MYSLIRASRRDIVLAALAAPLLASKAQAQASQSVVGVDAGANPYVIANSDGTLTGYNVDLVTIVAQKMGRSGVRFVDTPFAGIFAGLEARRYEFIAAPVTMTLERSQRMLFTEAILDSAFQFLTRRDGPNVTTPEDLRGKTVAVNNGSAYDTWLTQNEARYGFKIERYARNADAFQAVLARRAEAAMSGDGNVRYAAAQNRQFRASLVIETGAVFSWAFRRDDQDLRRQVEQIVECLKRDGTTAQIFRKWFGEDPAPTNAAVLVHPGLGQPGMDGHMPDVPAGTCS